MHGGLHAVPCYWQIQVASNGDSLVAQSNWCSVLAMNVSTTAWVFVVNEVPRCTGVRVYDLTRRQLVKRLQPLFISPFPQLCLIRFFSHWPTGSHLTLTSSNNFPTFQTSLGSHLSSDLHTSLGFSLRFGGEDSCKLW